MSDEDDDFEDLFSFGATTPGAANNTAKEATSTDSDFDVLMSESLSTPGTNGADKNNNDTQPSAAVDSSIKTPRSSSDIDEFDALFGTPPVNNNSATPSGDKLTAMEKDSLLAIDELPSKPLHSNFDDFHVHDEETRDMLDWLDDDNKGNKKGTTKDDSFSDINSNVSGDVGGDTKNTQEDIDLDDDFDFDKMLADVGIDDSNPPKSNPVVTETKKKEEDDIISTEKSVIFLDTNKVEEVPQTQVDPVVEETKATEEITITTTEEPVDNVTENTSTAKAEEQVVNTDDDSPTPIIEDSKPTISAGIEEELAFDKWEDDDEEEVVEDLQSNVVGSNDGDVDKTEGIDTSNTPQVQNQSTEIKPPPSPKKITFTSLSDAITSNASTIDDVRSLFSRVGGNIEEDDRANLWTKVICGKTFEDISNGSLADSYREWEKKDEVGTKFDGEEYSAIFDSLLEHSCGMTKEDEGYDVKKQQLISLSYFHSRNKSSTSPILDGIDPLIPPVALAILQAGIPPATASVVLSNIEPSAMPLLRLGNSERYMAAKALHSEFYLLACYHLPLLVMHLDRHCPGWYWPRRGKLEDNKQPKDKGDEEKPQDEKEGEEVEDQQTESNPSSKKKSDQLEENGLVPLSWFVTNFGGECGSSSCLNHNVLLQLWDNVLTNGDYSWKYFLAIAVLEKKSDILLMSRGDELKKELEKIVDFQDDAASSESFVGAGDESSSTIDGTASEWLSSAKSLMEATPSSVIDLLRSADDRAVANALKVRQTKVDKELQAELDAQEAALKKEREERNKAAEAAENKARLIAYYREVQPEKVETVDAILKMFDGRMGVLNEKLKKKVWIYNLLSIFISSSSFRLTISHHLSITVWKRILTGWRYQGSDSYFPNLCQSKHITYKKACIYRCCRKTE